MVLNDEQCGRFFDTMDSLLMYVNDRFRVVEGFTLDYDTQVGDMKAALVARALWENVEIIDEFVRENPHRLPRRCLDTALAWKNALPGVYTVVRYQGGRALMMNDVGVFSVGGVTLELEGEIGAVPAYVEIVLLPLDDQVVYDGFMQVYDIGGAAGEATRIQDDFESRCARGIVSTADEFIAVAGAYLAVERDKELDALLDDISREAAGESEALPEGFHRGMLAGLGMLEREAALTEELERRMPGASDVLASMRSDTETVERNRGDMQDEQAIDCAISSVIYRGVVEIGEVCDQYRSLVPDPLERDEFEDLVRREALYPDAYFGLWTYQSRDYLVYYTLTPDHITLTASRGDGWGSLRGELQYYEEYKQGLIQARAEMAPKPLSRTLMENTPLGELLGNSNVVRLRNFLDERIPDGQDDYTFADLAVQEFVLTSIESGSLEELYRLAQDLGIEACTTDEGHLVRLITNVFNAMPSWENNGWSPQELYEQLTGRRMFYNEDGTVMRVGGDDMCPCGSGLKYRECCGR